VHGSLCFPVFSDFSVSRTHFSEDFVMPKPRVRIGLNKALCVTLALVLSCCTSVTSRSSGSNNLGLVYFLPTTLIPVTLSFNATSGSIDFIGGQPEFLPDESQRYFLNSIQSPFHKETVDLKVTNRGLLTTFSVQSESQVTEIAKGIARSGGFQRESSVKGAGQQVYQAQIDLAALATQPGSKARPAATQRLSNEMNFALRKGLSHAKLADDSYLNHVLRDGSQLFDFSVERVTPYIAPENDGAPDCSVGFCYRLPVVYKLVAKFANGVRQEAIITVPNGSPTYVAALNRGVFANWTNTITINNGMLTGYKYQTSQSEFLGVVTLPFEVVGASIEALTQQGSIFTSRKARIDKEIAYLEALAKLEDKREEQLKAERSELPVAAFSFSFGSSTGSGAALNQPLLQDGTGVLDGPSGPTTEGNQGDGG
jgi:hypothetical protein